jgi:hypothetical protein
VCSYSIGLPASKDDIDAGVKVRRAPRKRSPLAPACSYFRTLVSCIDLFETSLPQVSSPPVSKVWIHEPLLGAGRNSFDFPSTDDAAVSFSLVD